MNVIWRTLLIMLFARRRLRRGGLLPATAVGRIRLRTLPTDIDVLRHMNNGRYLSLFDLGRWDLLVRTGLTDAMRTHGWYAVVSSETITFRKSLELWQRFTLESRLIGHDDRAIYLEHRAIVDGEIYARAIIRARLLKRSGGALTHDERTRLVLWVVAALIDVVGPRALFWVPGMGPTDPHTWSVRGSHMAERVSLFLIISLGESIIVTGTAFADLELDATTLLAFLAAFASTVLMWLLFFDRSEQSATAYFSSRTNPGMVAQTAYTYVPFLLIVGIVLTAVADEVVLLHPLGHTDTWTAGLICGAAAVYLLGNAFFRRATGGRWSVAHLVGVVVVLGVFLLRDALTPLALNWVSNGVLLAVIVGDVLLDRRRRQQQPEP